MNNKIKGFTLIELLAVIVILAIIALIITPIITGVISKAKDSANLRSAEAYVKAGENYFAKASTSGGTLDSNVIDDLEVSSKKAETGSSVIVSSNGNIELSVIIGDKCYRKLSSQSIKDITVSTDLDKCTSTNISNYAVLVGYKNISDLYNVHENDLYFLGSTQLKNQYVTTVTKADTLPNNCTYTWEAQDTSIPNNAVINACAVGSEATGYAVTLSSAKDIMAPKDATLLFGYLGTSDGTVEMALYTAEKKEKPEFLISTGKSYSIEKIAAPYIPGEDCPYSLYTLNLDWLNTSYTEDMSGMFQAAGAGKMQVLDLGDKFDTSNVINMFWMFKYTGYNTMTTLDLGSSFKSIATANTNIFNNTGKSGCTIKVSNEIYSDATHFKLDKNSSSTIKYSRGTIVSAY